MQTTHPAGDVASTDQEFLALLRWARGHLEPIGTFDVHWGPPTLDEIEIDRGFSLEALMQALGCVQHGDVTQGEHTR